MGDEEREVTVKSLAKDSNEDTRIQFLQEAVIVGQFKHPNVISLHGVLTGNDPMSVTKIFYYRKSTYLYGSNVM